jgi:2-polyprenyl-6-hydroxyphenyl methylase/3-demethylubiquinone-9 3-methyltransferase
LSAGGAKSAAAEEGFQMARRARQSTVDDDEVAKFSALADRAWDPSGPMAPLHRLNPVRLAWIKDQVCAAFDRERKDPVAYAGLRWLDVGCGIGLVSEPVRRLGAETVAIDASEPNIEAAQRHAALSGIDIDYRAVTAEVIAETGETFDVVTALEVVEHVSDVPLFVGACAGMVRPGGLMIAATINRTAKAFALAIVGAEYVLRWLPRGTHRYDRLVTPAELAAAFADGGLTVSAETGLLYVPIADFWRLSADMDVNYMMAAQRPPG